MSTMPGTRRGQESLLPSRTYEMGLWADGFRTVAGLDEAGRGAWAGPVVAAAVILPQQFDLPGLNDSKQISEKKRNQLYPLIYEQALAVGIGVSRAGEIDQEKDHFQSLLVGIVGGGDGQIDRLVHRPLVGVFDQMLAGRDLGDHAGHAEVL